MEIYTHISETMEKMEKTWKLIRTLVKQWEKKNKVEI